MAIPSCQSYANKFIPCSIKLCPSPIITLNDRRSFLLASKSSRCRLSSSSPAAAAFSLTNEKNKLRNRIDSTDSITKRSSHFLSNKKRNEENLSYQSVGQRHEMHETKQSPISETKAIQTSLNQIKFPIFYNDVYEVNLPPHHRFPMKKYRQVRERVQKIISPNRINKVDSNKKDVISEFQVSPLATIDELTTTHSPSYIQRYLSGDLSPQEIRNVGFPWSLGGVNRTLSSVGGTVAAAKSVCERLRQQKGSFIQTLNSKIKIPIWAAHTAGGTHHAFYDYGEGFCIFSDIAVAANVILEQYPDVVKKILILDLDVHQGNGNAKLFQGRDDVFTFSMHCEENLFSAKEQSDLDIGLPAGCTDSTYTQTLKHWLNIFEKNQDKYDIIFYQAGVDVLEDDRLGKMALTKEGVQRRNEMIFDFAIKTNKGFVITMGGGYPKQDWEPIIDAHSNVYIGAYNFMKNAWKKS